MSNIIFKFSNPLDGYTRRLAFASAPSWAELAGKLESIYSIPKEDICVSYTDADGDVLVLSSDAELNEHYEAFSHEQTDDSVRTIRFAVRSLSSVREAGGNMDSASADHEKIPASPVDNAIDAPALSAHNSGASAMALDHVSEFSVDFDGETIPRDESPPLPDVEALFALPPQHSRGRRGHRSGRGRVHGHHDPRDGLPLPPFPPFIAPGGMPIPPAVPPPPPFTMFGRGRGGYHAHMHGHGGMHRPLYHPHSQPFRLHRHHDRLHHPTVGMSAQVPPFLPLFPPMRGEFTMM